MHRYPLHLESVWDGILPGESLCVVPFPNPFPSRAQRGARIAKEVEDDGRVSVLKDARVEIGQVTGSGSDCIRWGGRLEISNHGLGDIPMQNQAKLIQYIEHDWLVVWTPLKNISQLGWLFPIYGKIKGVPNHQPDDIAKSMVDMSKIHEGTLLSWDSLGLAATWCVWAPAMGQSTRVWTKKWLGMVAKLCVYYIYVCVY